MRYEEYKESVSPFCDAIPAHWDEIALNKAYKLKTVVGNKDESLLSVFLNIGVTPYHTTDQKQVHKPSEDMSNYQLVEPGDFVLNNQQAWRGSVGISKYRGIISPAYYIWTPRKSYNDAYMNYMVRDRFVVEQFVLASKGVGSIQRQIYVPYMKNVILTIPPREEQDQIVRYLDYKVSCINRLIHGYQQEIKLLEEKKRTLVDRVVTRGLNPDAEMKDSGVYWLGEIPKHWDVKKLRTLFKSVSIKNRCDLPLLSVVREKGIILRNTESKDENHNYIPDDLGNYKQVLKGQFVINKMKAWQGSYGISNYDGIVSPAYYVFDVSFECLPFFHMAIRSKIYVNFFAQASDGIRVGQWDLDIEKLKEIPFFAPPIPEQQAIVEYIEKQTQDINELKNSIVRKIELLKEYRTRLISDVVTGQIDVRNIDIPEYEPEVMSEADTDEENDSEEDDNAD